MILKKEGGAHCEPVRVVNGLLRKPLHEGHALSLIKYSNLTTLRGEVDVQDLKVGDYVCALELGKKVAAKVLGVTGPELWPDCFTMFYGADIRQRKHREFLACSRILGEKGLVDICEIRRGSLLRMMHEDGFELDVVTRKTLVLGERNIVPVYVVFFDRPGPFLANGLIMGNE